MKTAKEDWIGAQCEEIETCLNKNNSTRAYQLVKDLPQRNRVGPRLSRTSLGNALLKKKRFSADGQNIAQNYVSCGDNAVLDCSQPPEEDLQPILREEVEIAVASLEKRKSAGVDNIPAELVQAGGETMIVFFNRDL